MKNKIKFSSDISQTNSFDFFRLLFVFSVFVAHFGVYCLQYLLVSHFGGNGREWFFNYKRLLIMRSYYRNKKSWQLYYENKKKCSAICRSV